MKPSNIIIASKDSSIDTYKECFKSKNSRWNIHFQTEVDEVKSTIAEKDVAVIILDRNFGENALELIDEIKSTQASSQIYLVIHESEREHLELTLGGQVAFLPKPFTSSHLVEAIRKALAIESWLGQEKVKKLISGSEEFSSLPHMYLKVMGALNSKDASVEQIGQLISEDIAITAKLLQVVNSSFFGFDEEVSDITHAVTVLGIDHVKSLVLAIQVFRRSDNPDEQAQIDRLLHHSMAVAGAAKRITKHEIGDSKLEAEAYTAGLLHDIGKLVLLNSKPEETQEAWKIAHEEKISKSEAETRILGANHSEVGAYILGRWGMPISVVEAAAFHHEPNHGLSASSFSTLASVYIANTMVGSMKKSTDDENTTDFDEEFMNLQGLPNDYQFWKDIIDGKSVAKKKGTPSLKYDQEPETTSSRNKEKTITTNETTSLPTETKSDESPKSKSKSGVFALIALAACAAIVAWLSLSVSSNSNETGDAAPITWDSETETEATDMFADSEDTSAPLTETPIAENIVDEHPIPEATQAPQEAIADSQPPPHTSLAQTTEESKSKKPVVATAVEAVKDLITPIKEKIAPTEPFPNVQLSGIFYSVSNPAANINGKIVRVGNSVAGTKVISISRNSVRLQFNDEQRLFKLD